jgi:hypothetical protein
MVHYSELISKVLFRSVHSSEFKIFFFFCTIAQTSSLRKHLDHIFQIQSVNNALKDSFFNVNSIYNMKI